MSLNKDIKQVIPSRRFITIIGN